MNEQDKQFLSEIVDAFDLFDLMEIINIGVKDVVERWEEEILDTHYNELWDALHGGDPPTKTDEEETEV